MIKIFIISLLLLVFNSCISVNKDKKELSLKITMETLEKELVKNFPIKENVKVGTLEIKNPSFIGRNKNKDKMDLKVLFQFSNFLIPSGIGGEVRVSTGISYNSKDSNLYLKDSMVEEFKISNFALSKFLTSSMREIIFREILRNIVKYPIYNLKKHSKLSFALKFMKNIAIEDGHILLSFGM